MSDHEVIEVERFEVGLSEGGAGGEVEGQWMLCSIH